jgi:phosphatidylglycerophosphate synthase
MEKKFAGDKKVGESILGRLEKRLVARYVEKIPKKIETYHLTLLTIPWSLAIILSGYLTRYNIHWLCLSSIMIIFQYITDLFDGAVGRHRNTGLIKWGYYMDHFLDYIFLCSILISYSFLIPEKFYLALFFILAILGSFMVNSYLSFAATNEFKIAYLKIGPTEVRILFIVINTLFILFGKTYLYFTLPFSLFFCLIGLIFIVFKTQKYLWKIDMAEKNINNR